MNILIFSRPVQTGKTTELMQWCQEQKNVAGILMPDVNGKRKMREVQSGIEWDAACSNPEVADESLVQVGRFYFYQDAFIRANKILLHTQRINYLVIDEIGRLELHKGGFHSAVQQILAHKILSNLLLVVRDNLLEDVIAFYQIKTYQVVHGLADIKKM
jgi:nucleoside-triphosphatase THEP1